MIFNNDIYNYLTDKKFSNGIKIKVAQSEKLIAQRLETMETLVKGKKVLHVGFADHIPLIKKKVENNTWLHKRLINASEKCVGIDIEQEAVNYVNREMGLDNIFCFDITKKEQIPLDISRNYWDYIILGEVLEHIDNPVHFLKSIKENFASISKYIVISVPNAWDLINIQLLRKNLEFINSDHRYWFTPYTLAKVGMKAGLSVESFNYVQNYPVGAIWKRILLRRFPILRETVLMVFKIDA